PEWRGFSPARWASSACHLYGRPVTSTETWTWLHAPSFRATPLDMKAEADLHFVEGINQLIGHGWPYSPPSAGEPGWRFYASAAFNDHNPWFQVMPDVAKYLQRMSYLMRQGSPDNDVAIYLPTDDAWAQLDAGRLDNRGNYRMSEVSIDRSMERLLGATLIPQVLDAGYNFDFIDDSAIAKTGVPYKVLIVPGTERMPLATLERVRAYAEKGGIVIATRRLPSLGPGLREEQESKQIHALAEKVFTHFVQDEQQLGSMLKQLLTPDLAVASRNSVIGFIHRRLENTGDIYFMVNTSNQPVNTQASIRVTGMAGEWWDPFTGETTPLSGSTDGKCTTVELHLAPYESKVMVFRPGKPQVLDVLLQHENSMDISADWRVTFEGLKQTQAMSRLKSWTDNPQTEYYSGKAVYEKTVDVPESLLKDTTAIHFGKGEPVPRAEIPNGMRALLE